ncbi:MULTISPECIES: carbapenem biosynthesis protein CpmG [Photorhabdus]|uniref:CpmJ protein n=4 Tax=Photorhabdus TaxID=29487 RepID=F5HDR0_PHOLL|nr:MULTISPECIES: carbapenem biosynthesis protein CpmG [Photorhabdus]AWK40816.1 spore coat protein CotH [Photorhabdus laumondii subsp. laumondii]AXG41623.1 spore coat protein CotH [Photorhabdus laumondii subsp. laumondii]AXG46149.1 spore coat protein CotH [Photorhabdus laumondii subsp. laumondii]MBS9423606.1 spore coat protein CotH [Photorhabdus caribbeanensis]MCT8344614.1 spore coat protein CotH [Photorhabdus kleinii]
MKNKFYLIFILLFSFEAFSHCGNKVNLKDGINLIDLNGDGKKDVIFYAKFENNTSHPSNTLTVFIKNKNGKFNIVPLPNDTGFTWFDFKLSASEIKIQDYELRVKNGVYYIIFFRKKNNDDDIFGEYPVEFIKYDIKYNNEVPGISNYYWDYTKSYLTKKKYKNVSDAMTEYNMECSL